MTPQDPTPLNHDQLREEDQFIRQFTKSQPSLYAYILGMTHRTADADDVLQEVNLALWRKREQYDPRFDFVPWAIGFARIEVSSHRKKHSKKGLVLSDDVLDVLAVEWPKFAPLQEQRLAALTDCLKKLAEPEHTMITEFYRAGASVKELSTRHDRPESTVYKILTRARKALRQCVQVTLNQTNHPALE